jgi:hypothetical protein
MYLSMYVCPYVYMHVCYKQDEEEEEDEGGKELERSMSLSPPPLDYTATATAHLPPSHKQSQPGPVDTLFDFKFTSPHGARRDAEAGADVMGSIISGKLGAGGEVGVVVEANRDRSSGRGGISDPGQ